ncbi:hypothetical protein AKJ16_DCAP06664 [Drosera capensis]
MRMRAAAVTWVEAKGDDAKESWYECVYGGSGKMPLLCSAIALVGLAVATLAQHAFMMIVLSKTTPPISVGWEPDPMPVKNLSCRAGLLFISTWVCFATAEMILLIGLSIESGHLKNWSTPRLSCLVVREGVFTAAGVFSLLTVFLAAGLYVVALRLQQELQDKYTVSQQILEASAAYASYHVRQSPENTAPSTTALLDHDLSAQPSSGKQPNPA